MLDKLTNEEFLKLDDAGQRVAIARDVLELLDLKKIKANQGAYIRGIRELKPSLDVKEELSKHNAYCNACAKGSMLLSHIMRFNECDVGTLNNYSDGPDSMNDALHERLKVFEPHQLNLIECAFEGRVVVGYLTSTEEYLCRTFFESHFTTLEWGNSYTWDSAVDSRLRAIMQNIIDNNGTFVLKA